MEINLSGVKFVGATRFFYKKVGHASNTRLSKKFQQILVLNLSYEFLKFSGFFCYFEGDEGNNIKY